MADYTGINKAENTPGSKVYSKSVAIPRQGGDNDSIITRENPIYAARKHQIDINIKGLRAGKEYIEARLSRFSGESKISFEGGTRHDGSAVTGRRDQAHCKPYLARIMAKLNQYIFSTSPVRNGIDETFSKNVTRDGVNINPFWQEVNEYRETCGWCWIGVDMPVIESTGDISILEKKALDIRPYWNVYSPLDVVDWKYDERGRLQWVLTKGVEYLDADPYAEVVKQEYRMLWQPGLATKFILDTEKDKIANTIDYPLTGGGVPFVLIGKLSPQPTLWDSLERINRTIMDLESAQRQNYFERCFPQLCLPSSIIEEAARILNVKPEYALSKIIGLNYPLMLAKDDQAAYYLSPDSGPLDSMRNEIIQLKQDLFEVVGFMLRKDSAAAESAKAKAWDHLDVQAVLKARANELEETELQVVQMSKALDADFKEYIPEYNKTFDVSNIMEDIQSIVMAGQMQLPVEVERLAISKVFELIRKIGSDKLTSDEIKTIEEAIATFDNASELTGFDPLQAHSDNDNNNENDNDNTNNTPGTTAVN